MRQMELAGTPSLFPEMVPDVVNHPAHYTAGGIECIDALEATLGVEHLESYCIGAAVKYLWRYKRKNGTEDLKKSVWYINKAIELRSRP